MIKKVIFAIYKKPQTLFFMKRLLLILFVVSAFLPTTSKADNDTSMRPIMRKTNNAITFIEDECNCEIVRIEFDILTAQKTSTTSTRTLSRGYEYTICAYGDDRFKDIDLNVYIKRGNQWVLVDKDDETSPAAAVTVTPTERSEYKFEISAYSFEEGYSGGHYGLIICHNKTAN